MASEHKRARGRRGAARADKDILIVDDEESLAFFLQQGLLEMDPDWQVDTAHTGEEAVVKINRSVYRLIIADLRMPGLNGLELLQMLRALEPSTDVILMTAYGSDEIAAEARRLGVFRYVNKPFRIEDMKAWVQEALALQGAQGAAAKPQAQEEAPPKVSPTDTTEVALDEEELVIEQEALPVEQETPPAEQETPPAEQETPPAEQETPPAEQEALPVGQEAAPAEPDVLEEEAAVEEAMAEIVGYLTQMRFRTGAQYVFVTSDQGELLAEAGSPAQLSAKAITAALAAAFEPVLDLGTCFEEAKPPMLLQAARGNSLFAVLVDSGWMLGMVFEGLIGARRVEAVWRYVDQAVETLDPILMGPVESAAQDDPQPAKDVEPDPTAEPGSDTHPETARETETPSSAAETEASLEEVLSASEREGETASGSQEVREAQADGDAYEKEAFEWDERPPDSAEEVFSLDEAQSLGLIDDELLAKLRGE